MTRMWIVVGDTTSSGGQVLTGSAFTDIDGKPVARVNDKATCPAHRGTFPIVDGDPTIIIDGEAVALHGSTLACGCRVLAARQMRVRVDGGGPAAASLTGRSAHAPSTTPASLPLQEISRSPAPAPMTNLLPPASKTQESQPVPEIEVVQLAPVITDEAGNPVPDSKVPRPIPHRHPAVKESPATNRIAHRELRILVHTSGRPNHLHSGKTVRWSMAPLFTPASGRAPLFRGDWAQAAPGHRDRFEASVEFGASGFDRIGHEEATTIVGADGSSAIRVNLPPVAFNRARISAQIAGMDAAVELIDVEVPGVIVLDPGHGGDTDHAQSSWNNAIGHTSGVLEKNLTLEICRLVRDRLRELRKSDGINLSIFMTRDEDENRAGGRRANLGRDRGADILMSVHFNGANGTARGTETWVRRRAENRNHTSDVALAKRINEAVYGALLAHDSGARNRGVKEGGWAVISDQQLGNTADYHPLRAILHEVEFIDHEGVDALLNTNRNHQEVRRDIGNAIADALVQDLWSNS